MCVVCVCGGGGRSGGGGHGGIGQWVHLNRTRGWQRELGVNAGHTDCCGGTTCWGRNGRRYNKLDAITTVEAVRYMVQVLWLHCGIVGGNTAESGACWEMSDRLECMCLSRHFHSLVYPSFLMANQSARQPSSHAAKYSTPIAVIASRWGTCNKAPAQARPSERTVGTATRTRLSTDPGLLGPAAVMRESTKLAVVHRAGKMKTHICFT